MIGDKSLYIIIIIHELNDEVKKAYRTDYTKILCAKRHILFVEVEYYRQKCKAML